MSCIGFASIGVVDGPALPAHGGANLRVIGANWFLHSRHNGSNAISDVSEFTEGTIAGSRRGWTSLSLRPK